MPRCTHATMWLGDVPGFPERQLPVDWPVQRCQHLPVARPGPCYHYHHYLLPHLLYLYNLHVLETWYKHLLLERRTFLFVLGKAKKKEITDHANPEGNGPQRSTERGRRGSTGQPQPEQQRRKHHQRGWHHQHGSGSITNVGAECVKTWVAPVASGVT